MKNVSKGLILASTTIIIFGSCKSLKLDKNSYTVTPNPLELVGDSVKVQIDGIIPKKTFHPKAIVTFSPTITTSNGQKSLKPIILVGTKVKGTTGTVVDWKNGGKISYSDVVYYTPEMKNSKLMGKLDGKIGSKSKTFEKELATGTIATQNMIMADEKSMMGIDNMPKMMPFNAEADILYTINSESVRPAEANGADVKALQTFINDGAAGKYTIKGASIAAYASPDGIEIKNADLANNRANTAANVLKPMFAEAKMDGAKAESFYTKTATPEDWEGFKNLMSQSNVPDKEMILRILTTYSDVETREKEMKNISKAYTEISDEIFPKLRRAKITVNAEKTAKTDEELKQLLSANKIDSLTAEELLYASKLTNDASVKMNLYNAVVKKSPTDWRAANNIGTAYLMQNKLNEAKASFETADKLSANNPAIKNNMGILARLSGDKVTAETMYKAAGNSAEAQHNLANLMVLNGKYAEAVNAYGSEKSFNAALANLLAGNKEAAINILDASTDATSGVGYYLKGIINARMGNKSSALEAIKAAITKDSSLKESIVADKEFGTMATEMAGL